jgi:large subunit ribosomal protein L35Ae
MTTKGTVNNYRGSFRTKKTNQIVVIPNEGEKNKEHANTLVGKKFVIKTSGGKELFGTVTKAHGNSGAVRVRFKKGFPGELLGKTGELR